MTEPAAIAYDLRCASHLVAALFDLPTDAFLGPHKGRPERVHARQVLCYLLHTEADVDQVAIARAIRRHRSTVGHSIQIILGLREEPDIDRALGKIGEMFRDLRDANARIPALIEEIAP